MMTVLLATHNSVETLRRTLEAFCALEPPPGGWKLVLVNNASTDGTAQIVSSYRERLPLEYVTESRLGKGRALNTGLTHVAGDMILFCDDDILPRADWLTVWRSAVNRHQDWSIFGGAVEPLYEAPPPDWLSRTDWEKVLYAKTDTQPEGPIEANGTIFGPNMAVRASALSSGIRFDENFLVGRAGLMGSETDFVYRLSAAGNTAGFVPDASVRHIVRPAQLSTLWMLKRFFRHGRTMFLFELRQGGTATARPNFRSLGLSAA